MKSARRHTRQIALQALFEMARTGHPLDQTLDQRMADAKLEPPAASFARELVEGVLQHRATIDALIAPAAPAWPIDQIALTDRLALEIGVYEMTVARETPVQVAINEAVELAKTFGGPNSGNFVNGVLRTIADNMAAHSQAH